MSWPEIKIAVNSTLGRNDFATVDQLAQRPAYEIGLVANRGNSYYLFNLDRIEQTGRAISNIARSDDESLIRCKTVFDIVNTPDVFELVMDATSIMRTLLFGIGSTPTDYLVERVVESDSAMEMINANADWLNYFDNSALFVQLAILTDTYIQQILGDTSLFTQYFYDSSYRSVMLSKPGIAAQIANSATLRPLVIANAAALTAMYGNADAAAIITASNDWRTAIIGSSTARGTLKSAPSSLLTAIEANNAAAMNSIASSSTTSSDFSIAESGSKMAEQVIYNGIAWIKTIRNNSNVPVQLYGVGIYQGTNNQSVSKFASIRVAAQNVKQNGVYSSCSGMVTYVKL